MKYKLMQLHIPKPINKLRSLGCYSHLLFKRTASQNLPLAFKVTSQNPVSGAYWDSSEEEKEWITEAGCKQCGHSPAGRGESTVFLCSLRCTKHNNHLGIKEFLNTGYNPRCAYLEELVWVRVSVRLRPGGH